LKGTQKLVVINEKPLKWKGIIIGTFIAGAVIYASCCYWYGYHKGYDKGTTDLRLLAIEKIVPLRVVNVYSYNEREGCSNVMASGKKVYPGAIAVSRDWVKEGILKFGDRVYIEDIGYFTVEDLMHQKCTWSVDIYEADWNKMKAFGRKRKRLFLVWY
jgi:3D (Asp-Asp-Asp) domain-containing protein